MRAKIAAIKPRGVPEERGKEPGKRVFPSPAIPRASSSTDRSFRPNEKLSTGGGFCFGDFEFFHGPDIFKLPASRDALFIPPPSPFPRCHFSLNIPRTFENFSPSLRMLPTKAGIFFRFFPNAISPASVCFVRPGQMSSVTVQAGVPYPPWLGIEASLLLTISSRISADTVRRRSILGVTPSSRSPSSEVARRRAVHRPGIRGAFSDSATRRRINRGEVR